MIRALEAGLEMLNNDIRFLTDSVTHYREDFARDGSEERAVERIRNLSAQLSSLRDRIQQRLALYRTQFPNVNLDRFNALSTRFASMIRPLERLITQGTSVISRFFMVMGDVFSLLRPIASAVAPVIPQATAPITQNIVPSITPTQIQQVLNPTAQQGINQIIGSVNQPAPVVPVVGGIAAGATSLTFTSVAAWIASRIILPAAITAFAINAYIYYLEDETADQEGRRLLSEARSVCGPSRDRLMDEVRDFDRSHAGQQLDETSRAEAERLMCLVEDNCRACLRAIGLLRQHVEGGGSDLVPSTCTSNPECAP